MVVEERTKRKDTAQHTKEETKAMENFLRVRYGMTNTEVSLILGQYGAATIEMLRQGIHEETLANALQTKAQPQEETLANALQTKAQPQEEALIINERKQHSTIEEKRREETASAVAAWSKESLVTTGLAQHGSNKKQQEKPEEKLTTKNQQKSGDHQNGAAKA